MPPRFAPRSWGCPRGEIGGRTTLTQRARSLRRVGIAASASALLTGLGLAAPAAAHVIGPGSGRTGASVAAFVALIGAVTGAVALARSSGRLGAGSGRDAAIVALVLGLVGMALAGLHLATSTGGIGTGNGRLGAIVGLVLGMIGSVLGQRALTRPSRPG